MLTFALNWSKTLKEHRGGLLDGDPLLEGDGAVGGRESLLALLVQADGELLLSESIHDAKKEVAK